VQGLFLTDGFREYLTTLVTHYGQWVQSERCPAKGPRSKLSWMPWPGLLLYAQVIKSYRRCVPGERSHNLLRSPRCSGALGDVKVHRAMVFSYLAHRLRKG
jgi:hypothetical protein